MLAIIAKLWLSHTQSKKIYNNYTYDCKGRKMQKKTILFLNGIADDKEVALVKIQKDGSIVFEHTGSANIEKYIQSDTFNKIELTFDTNTKQETMGLRFDAVFNQISDPDSHTITLTKVEAMQAKLPLEVPFYNKAENVRKSTRDNIYLLLQGIDGLHVPKTVKISPQSPKEVHKAIKKEGFLYPVIFRQAGDHGGVSTIRIDDTSEMFYPFALDGRDYYLTQYVEYKDENGFYSKQRLLVINGKVFLNDAMFSKNWMVHNERQVEKPAFKKVIAKDFSKKTTAQIQPVISEIYKRLGLDYFGIDCHIDKDMNLLIFEINANMSMFRGENMEKGVFKHHVKMSYNALLKMLVS